MAETSLHEIAKTFCDIMEPILIFAFGYKIIKIVFNNKNNQLKHLTIHKSFYLTLFPFFN